ncbi:MAG: flap structure-specific endonuclease [Candidatus Thermoplasmatota archaeon]|nr:flap structure-specific endonuclease [Candidatus Thermoplasmatota archaeon]
MGCNLKDLATPNPIQLSDLSGEKIAVDAFLTAYQFITSLRARGEGKDGTYLRDSKGRPVSHLMGFLDRCATMVEAGIDPVFVFDGRPHELKFETLAERKERRVNAVEKWEAAVEAEDWKAADKLGAQVVSYTPEMVEETQQMLDMLGIAWVEAPMEAEGAASVWCRQGLVNGVASQDWDVLLYGSPVMIRNLTSHGTKKFGRVISAERIVLSELLHEHEITHEQLVDLGIMVGTDFHPGIRGIGPKTGLKLIKEYGTIEAVCDAKEKEIPERLGEIRDLFMNHPIKGDLPASGMVDEDALRKFLIDERDFSERRVSRALDKMKGAGRMRTKGQSTLFDF